MEMKNMMNMMYMMYMMDRMRECKYLLPSSLMKS